MSGEKKGKERVRDANRRFRLSSSSLSVLIIKSNFVTPCQVGIKKERKENMREVDNVVSSSVFFNGFISHFTLDSLLQHFAEKVKKEKRKES